MKKRLVSTLLAVVMGTTMLSGCGGKAEDPPADSTSSSKDDEIVELVWQFPTSSSDLSDAFYDVENRLNEMMEKDIGVHVTFTPTSLEGSQQDATLMISSGEQLDIILTANTGLSSVINQGLVQPLDDYLEDYGPDIISHGASIVDMCYYNGELYSLPTAIQETYTDFAYNMKKEYVDKYGFEQDDNKLYTLDEMEEMFATVKEGEGDNFYMMVPWNNTYDPLNGSLLEFDPLTGSLSGGVLMLNRSFDDLTVYDLFETEEYKEYCQRMYDWAQKGYIAPDASVDTEYGNRGAEENYLGWFGHGGLTSKDLYTNSTWSTEVVQYRVVNPYVRLNGGWPIVWNVSYTCEHPEKAVEAINYIFKNVEAASLIQYGREGIEYEVVEQKGTKKVIDFLADASELEYSNGYGLWGDRFEIMELYPTDITLGERKKEFQESLPESRYSPAIGYCFVTDSVSSEIAAVESVMEQYCHGFNAGALDPEVALPEFIDALKAAGMDKIIAENQKQLDAWTENAK